MTQHWAEARHTAHVLGLSRPRRSELVPIEQATGRVLSDDIAALASVPAAPTSAMDGWAVAGEAPWAVGTPITAGTRPPPVLEPGHARSISTGALVPPGTYAILRSENGVTGSPAGTLRTTTPVRAGEHIRAAAEEAREGEIVLNRATRLTPPRVAVAAMCGHDHLRVASVPSVELLTLGNEILTTGVPTAGMVRDAFLPQLPAIVAGLGGRIGPTRHVGDTLAATMVALSASTADVTVTTGGSARGQTDHMRAALTQLGAELLIDGVRMRPGRPLILATLPGGKIVLALPGNPLAAITGLLSVGEPLISGLLGQSLTELGTVRLGVDIEAPRTHTSLVPYRVDDGVAIPTRWQGSAMMRGVADAAGICIIPPGGAAAGGITETLPLPWMTD